MASEKIKLLNESLELIAEKAGDVTPIIFDRYYTQCPEAQQIFLEHGFENTDKLEATMVDWVLYSVMSWFNHPTEVVGVLSGAAAHHKSLKIPFSLILSLMEIAFDVFIEHVRGESQMEALWCDLRSELIDVLKTVEH